MSDNIPPAIEPTPDDDELLKHLLEMSPAQRQAMLAYGIFLEHKVVSNPEDKAKMTEVVDALTDVYDKMHVGIHDEPEIEPRITFAGQPIQESAVAYLPEAFELMAVLLKNSVV